MNKLLCVALVLILATVKPAAAQPYKTGTELVFSASNISSCFTSSCKDVKVVGSIASTKAGPMTMAAVYKLDGDKGKLGGQALIHLSDLTWIAGKTIANFHGDMEHEILAGVSFNADIFNLMPYVGYYRESQDLGLFGMKTYVSDKISIDIEMHRGLKDDDEFKLTVSLGLAIDSLIFDNVQSLFN